MLLGRVFQFPYSNHFHLLDFEGNKYQQIIFTTEIKGAILQVNGAYTKKLTKLPTTCFNDFSVFIFSFFFLFSIRKISLSPLC